MKKLAVIISILLFVFTACNNNEVKKELEKSIPVRIVQAKTTEISFPISSSGKISSKAETKLSFKTGGIVQQIFVEEGQQVSKGQLLAILNLSEIEAKVNQARAGLAKAERDYQRVEALYKDSVVTLEQLQNVKTAFDVAKSNMEIANFNLNYSKIIAPGNGKILKRFVEENELIGVGSPVFIFGTTGNSWIVRIGVTDKDITKIKYNNKAQVSLDALPNEHFDAMVTEIASAANPYNGMYEVELTVKTKSANIVSGMIARVKLYPESKEKAKVIPVEALVNADGKNGSVFIPTENNTIAKKVNIEIGEIINSNVIVKKGLDNVSVVITDGVEYLVDGEKIKVIK